MEFTRVHKLSGSAFRSLLALTYLLLAVSAAWHAPHSFRNDPVVSASDSAPVPASVADTCALCAWQSLSQEVAAAPPAPAVEARLDAVEFLRAAAPAGGWFLAFRARGPPPLLS